MIEHPRAYERDKYYWTPDNDEHRSTYFLWSTDYIRLKNLEIGYTFNFPGVRHAGIQNLRVYANGSNLFTLDNVKIQDPEQNNTGKDYPQRRIMNLGVSVTF
jgi:hypothetical protein